MADVKRVAVIAAKKEAEKDKIIEKMRKALETVKRWLEANQRDKSILYKPVCAALESAKV